VVDEVPVGGERAAAGWSEVERDGQIAARWLAPPP